MNSKNKGNSFERLISKKLSLWFSDGHRDDLFWRTQSSGGRFTSRNKKNLITENQEGDICSTSNESLLFSKYIAIECKHYKEVDIWGLLFEKGKIIDWYKKIRNESKDKFPMLIFRQNYKPILMLCGNGFHLKFQIHPYCYIHIDEPICLSLYEFEEFLKVVPGDYFRKKLGEL